MLILADALESVPGHVRRSIDVPGLFAVVVLWLVPKLCQLHWCFINRSAVWAV